MVLGLKTKPRKSPSVQLDYIVHIQEIKPWPPSQSLRTLRAVSIQWEHGDRTSGSTNQVVPSLGTGSGVGDGRIEFNEAFRLPVTLTRDMSIKGGDGDVFQKNCIEFNLYEPRRDKTVKGQLLGTAIVDLADYGIVKDSVSISASVNCKRTYRNTVQPLLFLKIQPLERSRSSSSSRDSLMREASMDRNHGESVSRLMSEEYAEEAEVASFSTDDDVSSHSSLAINSSAAESNGSSSPFQSKENGAVAAAEAKVEQVPNQSVAKSDREQLTVSNPNSGGRSSRSSSVDLSSDLAWISKKIRSQSLQPASSEEADKQSTSNTKKSEYEVTENNQETVVNVRSEMINQNSEDGNVTTPLASDALSEINHLAEEQLVSIHSHKHNNENTSYPTREGLADAGMTNSHQNGSIDDETEEKCPNFEEENRVVEEKGQEKVDEPLGVLSQIDVQKQMISDEVTISVATEKLEINGNYANNNRSKQVKSVRSSMDSSRSNGLVRNNQFLLADTQNNGRSPLSGDRKDPKMNSRESKNMLADSRIQQLERKIKFLEGELTEAAALEVSLYSVVAEHGSSTNKVHAPARRLSRLYFHSVKQNSRSKRGSAAKSILSGLVLVAKACGNDVPRLTFWLSNSIMLRAIISKYSGDIRSSISLGASAGPVGGANGKKSSPLKWESLSSKSARAAIEESLGDWENPLTFAAGLEKVEAWIFSRIIESIWWQTFTPHMQSGAAKAIHRSMDPDTSRLSRTSSSMDQQGNFSLELWRKAFGDACERICPVRAEGHDCGCLAVISGLIMEQLIARLDVAMFNAILRESADEIPTDPVSDPISDAEVLPIPAGTASFGAGAQLKNAIGNWSRWLSDLFGIDDDDVPENENGSEAADDDERLSCLTSSKAFHLLNALSDLMMLPKDMLLSRTIRKEVCPTFGPPLIQRVLNYFVPDEFCPDPIPRVVLEALNSEDSFDSEEEDYIMNFPCGASPIVYQAPSAASVASVLGETGTHPQLTRNGSSVLKKSLTSDDELEELDSPLKSIVLDSSQAPYSSECPVWASKDNGSRKAIRYQLLQEVWKINE